jgi:hypothetical protein
VCVCVCGGGGDWGSSVDRVTSLEKRGYIPGRDMGFCLHHNIQTGSTPSQSPIR